MSGGDRNSANNMFPVQVLTGAERRNVLPKRLALDDDRPDCGGEWGTRGIVLAKTQGHT